jgi:hypothetical protein
VRESKETSEALRRHAHALQLHILAQTTAFATQKHALEQALAAKEQQAGCPPQHEVYLLYQYESTYTDEQALVAKEQQAGRPASTALSLLALLAQKYTY